ncbi:MAG: gamma-glutamyltransferase [Akkermansiaceae bacterium]|nr:gamma-glutamyltransferase [Akkermansiaceae bacterium]NNM31250.1 gamma-glutamyltransferase [Akkermansiaceae bacterium]
MRGCIAVVLAALTLPAGSEVAVSPGPRPVARGTGGAVASPHPLATAAGMRVLRNGGNAIDAAVAVGLTLGVVDGHNSGIGGGCFLLARLPSGEILAIDGRETAPAAATRDMYLDADGKPDPAASRTGPRASGVPGSLAAYDHVLRRHGSTDLRSHLEAAADLAARGFRIDAKYARRIAAEAAALRRWAGPASPLFRADGKPLAAGDTLRQPDLAITLRAIGEHGIKHVYGGEFATRVARWMRENGGVLTEADFAGYTIKQREPVRSSYRGHGIVGFPPPSSGGVHVAQILNILERFPVPDLDDVARTHLVAEAMKLAFADRAHWLGDPDFVEVPAHLTSEAYARTLAGRIDLRKATVVEGPGPAAQTGESGDHTAHFTVVDPQGTWVACTATLNTSFGSKVVIPGTGVVLNNQMDDFSIAPGVPNAFGLVGAEANAVAPRKRPLSSMSPTIVLRDGEPVLTVGAAGGPTIISQALLVVMRHIDLGLPLEECVRRPRFHHQWKPDRLTIETALPAPLREALTRRGHDLAPREAIGVTQAIIRNPDGIFTAVSDFRAPGRAAVAVPRKPEF